jgi:hypothetical protein
MDRSDTPPHAATTQPRTARRRGAWLGAALLCLPLLLAGCGDDGSASGNGDGGAGTSSDTSAAGVFCETYEGLSAAAEELASKDPATADVEELRAASEEVQTALDDFQAAAEGPIDDVLTRLRAGVEDVRQAAQEAGAQASEAAQPVIQDALARVEAAWVLVQDLAEARCPPDE